ncbi:MAG: PQQ-dependent sugar dehydrogenase [Flavisolibacter sp.]
MIKFLLPALTGLMLLSYASVTKAQPPVVSYSSFITGLTAPIDLVNAGDGSNRLFIVQQGGLIRLYEGGVLYNFLNMGPTGENLIATGGEQGLLSMVFHPDYDGSTVPYFYVYYTNTVGDLALRRYSTTAGAGPPTIIADVSSDALIMTIPHPTNSNHNGGKLNFGTDGYLYFATGDGGGGNDPSNNAQNGNNLLGKMLRIDVNSSTPQTYGNYGIPASNPYVGDAAIRDEIWALGLRNPFRWSFDRANGNMWIGDVGQGAKEEVNFRPAGSTGHVNYGWRCFEGYISTPGVADCTPVDNVYPVYDYDNPGSGSSAVVGGYVYRGTEYPNFRGYYMATDTYIGSLYFLWPNGAGGFDSSVQALASQFIVGFGEAEDGTLYAVSQSSNAILKVVAAGGTPLPVTLTSFTAKRATGFNELKWNTATEQNTARFIIEFSLNGNSFNRAGEVAASRNENGSAYSFRHHYNSNGTMFYRLAIQDDDGSTKYSTVLRVAGTYDGTRIYPTVVRDRIINLSLEQPAEFLRVMNAQGGRVFEKNLNGATGSMAISLPALTRGIYFVQVMMDGKIKTEKIIVE